MEVIIAEGDAIVNWSREIAAGDAIVK